MLNEFLGDGPIPGSSFTEEVGTAPWQKPPKITLPTEAFQEFLNVLEKDDNYDKLVFCMEEGLPIEGIANTIVNNMVGGGKISYDLALLLIPEIARVLVAIGNDLEIDYVLRVPTKVDTRFAEAQIERMERLADETVEEIEEDTDTTEEEPEEEEPKRKGLMGA